MNSFLNARLGGPLFCNRAYRNQNFMMKNNVSGTDFSDQFRKVIIRYKRTGHNINAMRKSACLVVNPTLLPSLIACRLVVHQTK